jgi:flagellar biosynthesis protein FlhA
MSNRSSMTLPLLIALGAGALAGLSAAATQKDRLPQLGGPKPLLEGAQPLPAVEIALGAELAAKGGQLRGTVEQVPEVIRSSLGFGPSHLSFKEDLSLAPRDYAIRLRGLAVAHGTLQADRLLALRTIETGEPHEFPGEVVTEPVTGASGVWISQEDAGRARLFGYDVLEPGFLLALHVDTALRRHLYELLTREETYRLLDRAKQTAPRTVEELTGKLEVGLVQKVLQALLREQVSLRDLPQVLELLADAARASDTPEGLTAAVRTGLARQLSAALAADQQVLHVLPLGARWESLRHAQAGDGTVREVVSELRSQLKAAQAQGLKPILIAPTELRVHVRRLLERELPDLPVLAEHEVAPGYRIEAFAGQGVGARG